MILNPFYFNLNLHYFLILVYLLWFISQSYTSKIHRRFKYVEFCSAIALCGVCIAETV